MSSFSMADFTLEIWFFSCEFSLLKMDTEMTGREIPHARPSACFDGTKTYATFWDAH